MIFPWDLEKKGRELKVRVEGQLIFNNMSLRLASTLQGLGLAYMPEDQALSYIANIQSGRLTARSSPQTFVHCCGIIRRQNKHQQLMGRRWIRLAIVSQRAGSDFVAPHMRTEECARKRSTDTARFVPHL